MNSKYVTAAICMSFAAMLFLSGLVSNAQAEEGKNAARQDYSEKESFRQQANEKLADLDKKIAELEVKIKEAGSDVKAGVIKSLKKLKKQRAALKKDMKKLEASGKDTWEAAKQKVSSGLDELEKAYNKVRDYFR
jgi:peptidoglycan hydrolase CwlO-like protein